MKQQTTMDEKPITLPLPLDGPKPAPGCGVCTALARQSAQAAATGDYSKASDCNVEIRNHPHRGRRTP
ncbi:hypothetical protein ACFYPT_37765 [Streptomyces sp. NPDC005529]|uniref:hypothetical protein n=1 Tax=unclassified Streptomyces TaxID=2593676 RepID=UPI0033A16BB1